MTPNDEKQIADLEAFQKQAAFNMALSAHAQGMLAFKNGQPLTANPNASGTITSNAWYAGWSQAHAESGQ